MSIPAVEIARFAWGTCELLMPDALLHRLVGAAPDRRARLAVRVLGARDLVQAFLMLRTPISGRASGGVDLLHAGSMVVLATVDRRRRTTALASAAVAFAFAAAEFAAEELSCGGRP
ncbi:hypothetical protein [Arthrobacter bambusae]|uniref:hypothetical protein n=1 Tax=Arthrobacter bambusae TaxID=1338426 RepID=UPI00277F4F0B|nr:hypothetical protein [Arthrobacter bambusae]MDQ0028649.1 hypothetical protein [Arthrobacter bambusae]MDQ0096557.1 hypothetical protein [Arthrobacter bambusae]